MLWNTKYVVLLMRFEKTNNKVKIERKSSPGFEKTAGLRQGDTLSTRVLNFNVTKVIRNVKSGGKIKNKSRQCLLYADVVLVLGRTVKYVAETIASQIDVAINAFKIKRMINKGLNGT